MRRQRGGGFLTMSATRPELYLPGSLLSALCDEPILHGAIGEQGRLGQCKLTLGSQSNY